MDDGRHTDNLYWDDYGHCGWCGESFGDPDELSVSFPEGWTQIGATEVARGMADTFTRGYSPWSSRHSRQERKP
jgi:hypothetical protein